jgi:hypothetical protein
LAAQNSTSQKLKFSEWRPIGVCDDAPPGIQKAQMFTREDFLVVIAPGVNRDNWRKNTHVMKILYRYGARLAKQSTRTNGMKQPEISNISLVGAVMKLAVTPLLNRESKDGKLQLFQMEYEDKGMNKKWPRMIILGLLLVILLLLAVFLGVALYRKAQSHQLQPIRFRSATTTYHCENPGDPSGYEQRLNEVGRIVQLKVNGLFNQGRLTSAFNCVENKPQLALKEQGFLECYALVQRNGMLSQLPPADLKKVKACQKALCRRDRSSETAACQTK